MRRARQRRRGVAARDVDRRQHIGLRRQRLVDGEDRGQRLEVELRELRRAPRGVHIGGGDGEYRLPGEFDDIVREDRVVVLDRADVVDAGNIGRGDDGHDARHGVHVGQRRVRAGARARPD